MGRASGMRMDSSTSVINGGGEASDAVSVNITNFSELDKWKKSSDG